MPNQSSLSREGILSGMPTRAPLRNSSLYNLDNPVQAPSTRGNALLDKEPEVFNTKRQHQPTAGHKEHVAQIQKNKEVAKRRQETKSKGPVAAKSKSKPINDDSDSDIDNGKNQSDEDDPDADELNLSPKKRRTKDTDLTPEELQEIADDIWADSPEITTPTRATQVTVTSLEPRKIKTSKQARVEEKLEERNVQRLQASRAASAHSQPAAVVQGRAAASAVQSQPATSLSKRTSAAQDRASSGRNTQSSPAASATQVDQTQKRTRTLSLDAALPIPTITKRVRQFKLPGDDELTDDEAAPRARGPVDIAPPSIRDMDGVDAAPPSTPAQDGVDAALASAPAEDSVDADRSDSEPEPGAKKKSKKVDIKDLEGKTQVAMLHAADVFQCKILTEDAFPSWNWEHELDMKADSIEESFLLFKVKTGNITKQQLRYISYRSSTIRGRFKSRATDFVAQHYGFRRGATKATILYNKALAAALTNDYLFTYADIEFDGFDAKGNLVVWRKYFLYGSDLFHRILAHVLFKTKESLGFRYKAPYFRKASLELIALITTAIECAIDEWAAGTFVKIEMTDKAYGPIYRQHLEALKKWTATVTDDRLDVLQSGMLEEARKFFIPVVVEAPPPAIRAIPQDDIDQDNDNFIKWRKRQEDAAAAADEEEEEENPEEGEVNGGEGKGKAIEMDVVEE